MPGFNPFPIRSFAKRASSFFHELIFHVRMDNQPTAGRTPLACRPKGAPDDAVHGKIEVGIFHHQDGVLPSHLKRHSLVVGRRRYSDFAAGGSRAGKRDQGNLRMADQRLAQLCATS